eukprot:scaffold67545_cov30-Tisochrysis_lutea.AAC.3
MSWEGFALRPSHSERLLEPISAWRSRLAQAPNIGAFSVLLVSTPFWEARTPWPSCSDSSAERLTAADCMYMARAWVVAPPYAVSRFPDEARSAGEDPDGCMLACDTADAHEGRVA